MAIVNGTNFNDNNTLQFNGVILQFFPQLDGTNGNDIISGFLGTDILLGFNGNDTLDGGAGADNMNGGDQNDTYFVDDLGDIAAESFNDALGGVDTVNSSVTHTLGFGIEHLNLTGAAVINGTGNGNSNNITGNSAANTVRGLGGNDTLAGLGGNDQLFGGSGNDTLIGDDGNDILRGEAGNDILRGGNGDDILAGGLGNDTLFAGLGATDHYLFDTTLNSATNVDTISGFFAPVDTIRLDNDIFTSFGLPGAIAAGNFRAGPGVVAADANDFLLYNTTTGALSYDANGNGAGAAIQFASLSGVPPLSAADFLIVN
ncbi:calcium-binding protein [Nitrosomonas sp.]|uniref:calcium-binding protein n=1 Tax=Nitrosomonas sp. TaxID=42353 RepID=UPI00262F0E39|nr:calcium-binding protein [Nitrosomonas sp.]